MQQDKIAFFENKNQQYFVRKIVLTTCKIIATFVLRRKIAHFLEKSQFYIAMLCYVIKNSIYL